MADRQDRLEDLERRRVEVEANAAKLRTSLLHWQAWEIEYEGMKEEILELGKESTLAETQELADRDGVALGDTNESLLTRKEKFDILRNDKGVVRSREQILNLLSRRIDYVQQNIKSVRSLLSAAEEKLLASEVLKDAKALNEEGLPLTEIHEELDEEGNVISSSTSMPGQGAPKAVEAIKQAANNLGTKGDDMERQPVSVSNEGTRATPSEKTPNISKTDPETSMKKTELPKKRVSFVNEKEEVTTPSVASNHKASEQDLLKEISDREADELERNAMAESIIPENESPEDAALRRQMIQYNMDEVGAVVAEIDLEDDGNSQSEYDSEMGPEDDDQETDDGDEDEDEEEDEFGRTSKSKPLNENYVKRMQALSDKLKSTAMINIGSDYLTEAKREPDRSSTEANGIDVKRNPPKKKGVQLAEELDIQEAPEVSVANLLAASSAMTGKPITQPPVAKRATSAEAPTEETDSGAKKISKFKAARTQAAANASIAKTFNSVSKATESPKPPSQILADTLVERPFIGSESKSSSPSKLDDLDPGLLKSQVSTEYHRLRNRQIQCEGGFVRNCDDQPEVQLTEEEGGPKKMSRFKAARLGLQ